MKRANMSVGDVVSLRSGGASMTIVRLDDESAFCAWLDKTNRLRNGDFPVAALRPSAGEFDGIGDLIIEGVTHSRAEIDEMSGVGNA